MKIGITGGIGSGKSYICNILKGKGFPVYNCDDEAKMLMVNDHEIIDNLRMLISEDAYVEHTSASGETEYVLNKPIIAEYLFANPNNAAKVNGIVHPVVKRDFLKWADKQDSECVFMECAILFESGFDSVVDKCVLIYADEDKRLRRAMKRDNATEEKIKDRMRHQISGEDACSRADYIFDHNEYDTTDEEIEKLLCWLQSIKTN